MRGQPSRIFFEPDRKLLPAPPNNQKKHCLCIFGRRLATNPILSALRLQGLNYGGLSFYEDLEGEVHSIWES
jgi:hypothetical protein